MSPVKASPEFRVLSSELQSCDSETCGCAEAPTQNPALSTQHSGKTYWRSVEDLADTPEFREFMHREFPAGASEMLDSNDRRQFLKIMGASMALAGMGIAGGGCRRWPEEKIAPYAYRPPGHNPGSTDQFATCMDIGGVASALLVTSYDYRPIKVDGNPEHPMNQGASDAMAQASILDLYDPDRSRSVMHKGEVSDWAAFTTWAKEQLPVWRQSQGQGLAILSEATSSPSVAAMKKRLQAVFPKAAWHEYEPLNNDNVVKGSALAFGSPHRTHYSFDKASVIVSLDADFLSPASAGPVAIKWMRDFARSRRAEDRKTMSRLYMFESSVSLTGANADHRVAMSAGEVPTMASLLGMAMAASLEEVFTRDLAALKDQTLRATLEHLVADLKSSRGKSIVIAGAGQPAEVHYLAHLLNETLGNVGHTVMYTAMPDAVAHVESIKSLAANISAGQVTTLVMLCGNPVYNAPADVKFGDLLKSVATTIHLSDYVDETSQACVWHVNRAHYLEAWGDGRAYDGTISIAQPLIDPLFGGKSAVEVLAALSGDEKQLSREIVQRTIRDMGSGMGFDAFWNKALHDGFIEKSAAAAVSPAVQAQNLKQHVDAIADRRAAMPKGESMEVVFLPDASVLDGRFANNGWLQELPDPITKLTWDNAALMSPAAAKSRGLKTGSMVTLGVNGREIQAAVMVVPGQYAGSIGLALGYGRSMAGRICAGAGFNAFAIRGSDSMGFAGGATVTATGATYTLASTQDHHAPDTVGGAGTQERLPTLFREANLTEYHETPRFAAHRTHVVHRLSLFEEAHSYQDAGQGSSYAWGMSIDLNACTGCNACVIACQAENNIPIVGKDQVRRNREMHWIRIDRYYKGVDEEHPDGFMLAPVTCMHCENAPCEQVCPVAATTHDDSGLNVMVYNRCVGTRYCSNNCPYKVRRFNYFDYWRREPHREQPGMLLQVDPDYFTKGQAKADPLRQLQFNPDVTVRMRGIMEKCTFCIQRISKARSKVKNDWVQERNLAPDAAVDSRIPIPDGMITPACAQVCPAQAIVFGDLRDPKSRVSKLHAHERTYQMLEELNTKPRTQYMAKIRNPAFGGEQTHSHG